MSDAKEAAKLLRMARKDLQAMRALAAPEVAGIETFGFHAQQAVEKGLKAWLAAKGVLYPRIHDLDRLFDLLREQGAIVPPKFDALGVLTDFGVAFRYEPYEDLDEPFARAEIIAQVEGLLNYLAQLLSPENPQ
jgi:HEPN domain-containing protein